MRRQRCWCGDLSHGKSSFIDSLMRFIYEEDNNLVRRAGSRAPDMYSVLHVYDDDWDDYFFRLVDSPGVASEDESKSELLRVLKQGVWHKMRTGEEKRHHAKCKRRLRPECVILVVSCTVCNMSELRALADTIHGTGTPFVVAVTHKDSTKMQVADACRNESVFCFENYVRTPDDSVLEDVEQNDKAMSMLLMQAMSYIWEDRINDSLYSKECCEEEKDKGEATVDDKKEGSHNLANVRNSHESFEFL